MINRDNLVDRFIRYVKIDTQSDDTVTDRFPSTEKQLVLSKIQTRRLQERKWLLVFTICKFKQD